ncbi:MAG: AraC family transcriptional regulator [Kiritimatiellae bacterium]|jgi:AraC family transcriptional regulator of arabinose operon|nr:AraC family transcriptional regulator [Kiritimatiellia bacterium]
MQENIIIPINKNKKPHVQIQLAGESYCDGSYEIVRGVGNNTYVFEYIDSGEGILKVGTKQYHPHAGDVYIAPAHTNHMYRSDAKNPWIKYWLNVKGSLISSLLEVYCLNGVHYFTKCTEIKPLFIKCLEILKKDPSADLSIHIHEIIIELHKNHSQNLPDIIHISPESAIVQKYIESHITESVISLEKLASLINKSKPQLIRIFKKDLLISPYQYFLKRKIERSCELLVHSRKSIKEIAYFMGFTDEFYFSNIFKKRKGVSPSVYRKERNH